MDPALPDWRAIALDGEITILAARTGLAGREHRLIEEGQPHLGDIGLRIGARAASQQIKTECALLKLNTDWLSRRGPYHDVCHRSGDTGSGRSERSGGGSSSQTG